MTDQLDRLHRIFSMCADAPLDQREHILAEQCGDDAELADNVRRLLGKHTDTGAKESGFLRLDASDPERVGPYRLLQRLGEGGMGIVYAADQREPVRRRVALKVLRHGHGSREVVARFDAERHALALMNHPNIARIFDAGTTADHRPFIVMEFVPGTPLTRYCEQNELPLRERLDLFCTACDAVQHAHQRGVIHRDLKPSNILVMEDDGRPIVKIIDFGIAKAVSHRLTDHTLETKVGSLLGTPDYMSPEQAELSPLDVDTRADVYALGAVLYELLTGTPPLQLAGAGLSYAEILRVIHDRQPVPPSQRAGEQLRRRVRGELDWITMKALEKNRNDRYPTAADLERDVRAYLEDRTVSAGPPSPWRGMHKFVRRHWFGSAATLVVFAALTGMVFLLAHQNRELQQERDRAAREAEVARQVTDFTAGLFDYADPADSGSIDISASQLLDAGVLRLEHEAVNESAELRAALYAAAGRGYHGLGQIDKAEQLLQLAIDTLRKEPAHDLRLFADIVADLAQSKRERGLLDEAVTLAGTALAALQDIDAPEETFRIVAGLAETLRDKGQFNEAAELLAPWLADGDSHVDPVDFAYALSLLGSIRSEQARFDEAESLFRQAMERQRKGSGESQNNLRITRSRLASMYIDMGRPGRAEPLLRESLADARARYGEMHNETATALSNLANAVSDFPDRYAEAEALYLEAIGIRARTVGEEHPSMLTVTSNLAWLHAAMEKWQSAYELYSRVASAREKLFGEDYPGTANARIGQAKALVNLGRIDEAVDIATRAARTFERIHGKDHWRTADVDGSVARALLLTDRRDEGIALLESAYERLAAGLGEDHPRTQRVANDLEAARNGSRAPD